MERRSQVQIFELLQTMERRYLISIFEILNKYGPMHIRRPKDLMCALGLRRGLFEEQLHYIHLVYVRQMHMDVLH